MTVRNYILCTTPRSGSTLLCDLLRDTGVAGRPASYFRDESIPSYARRLSVAAGSGPQGVDFPSYLKAVQGLSQARGGVFALRLMSYSLADLSCALRPLTPGAPSDRARFDQVFGAPRYVYLWREDALAQAISLLRARQTGLWHRAADGTERERTAPDAPAVYDRAALQAQLSALRAQNRQWRDWFAAQGVRPLTVRYDALAADPRAALARVLRHIGAAPGLAARAQVQTAPLADGLSADWAARFRAEGGA